MSRPVYCKTCGTKTTDLDDPFYFSGASFVIPEYCEKHLADIKAHPPLILETKKSLHGKKSVWVALWSSQMDSEFLGVFSTEELAQKAAYNFEKENTYGDGYIEEWEIDKGPIRSAPKYFIDGKWQ